MLCGYASKHEWHLLVFIGPSWIFTLLLDSMVKSKGNEHWAMGSSITLSKMGYSALKRVQAVSKISSLVPGSSSPNWLQGKANISKPESGKNKQAYYWMPMPCNKHSAPHTQDGWGRALAPKVVCRIDDLNTFTTTINDNNNKPWFLYFPYSWASSV